MAGSRPRRIVLDTDTGTDDALAVMLALLSPELKVEAITTVGGNAAVDLCTRNARLVVEQLGLREPPPIYKGAARPLAKPLVTAPEVHGADGMGGVTELVVDGRRKYPEPSTKEPERFAPQVIAGLAATLHRELSLVTLGPLTNIALAIREDRAAMASVAQIIVMGGAFRVYGNTTPVAEFNMFVDPHAAEEVLELGVPVTIVPLDVTEQTVLGRAELQEAYAAHPTKALEVAVDVSSHYMDYHADHDGIDGCYMHDPLTVGVSINSGFVRTVEALVRVERVGEWTQGMTVADLRPSHRPDSPNARVAVDVSAQTFLDFFLQRLRLREGLSSLYNH